MIIGIEAERANNKAKTGVEHYVKELIQHFAKIDSQNQYVLYLQTEPQDWFLQLPPNFKLRVMPFPKFWTQIRLSWEMIWHAPDVLFVPASTLPLIHPKSVYTEHDVAWIYYPEIFTPFMRWFHRIFSWLARRGATKIISISESTKKDLVEYYQVAPEKIAVVQHGYTPTDSVNEPLSPEVAAKLPEKYVLFLSTLQPRKNLELLIDAFRVLKEKHPDWPHKLVVVGKPGWKFQDILKKIADNQDIVVYLGHIKDNDRWPVYKRAEMFIHPSLYEGFGMWILEAFECGIPVAVSNNSSLPEVGGNAALYFDPTDKQAMVEVMEKVLSSPELRAEMIAKGKQQLQKFSWEKSARETLAVLEAVGGRG